MYVHRCLSASACAAQSARVLLRGRPLMIGIDPDAHTSSRLLCACHAGPWLSRTQCVGTRSGEGIKGQALRLSG